MKRAGYRVDNIERKKLGRTLHTIEQNVCVSG